MPCVGAVRPGRPQRGVRATPARTAQTASPGQLVKGVVLRCLSLDPGGWCGLAHADAQRACCWEDFSGLSTAHNGKDLSRKASPAFGEAILSHSLLLGPRIFFFFKSITYTYIYILICSFGFLKNHVYLQSLIYVIKKASGLFLKSSFRFTEEFHGKCEDFP